MRNNNGRMYKILGADSGWDSIGQYPIATSLSNFLNELDKNEQLSKTILYNLNPADNAMMAAMIGNFNDGSIAGKVQWGSGWWFLDQIDGITNQINTLSNIGIISCFIGMLTDSRSFLPFQDTNISGGFYVTFLGMILKEVNYQMTFLGLEKLFLI